MFVRFAGVPLEVGRYSQARPGRRRQSRLALDGAGDVDLDLPAEHRDRRVREVRDTVGRSCDLERQAAVLRTGSAGRP